MFPNDPSYTIIDSFSPKPLHSQSDIVDDSLKSPMSAMSPTSSSSTSSDSAGLSSPRPSFEAFIATRSRVVKTPSQFYNLPRLAESYLSALFLPQSSVILTRGNCQTLRDQQRSLPVPISLWTMSEEYSGQRPDSIWAVFKTHEEAANALSLSGPAMSVTTALESDLEPFHKLRRFVLSPPSRLTVPDMALTRLRPRSPFDHHSATMIVPVADYTLSSNPPNPRTSFRLGDWMRNLTCIGCGCPRSNQGTSSNGSVQQQHPHQQAQSYPPTRNLPSPRFSSFAQQTLPVVASSQQQQQPIYTSYSQSPKPQQPQVVYQSSAPVPPIKSAHPLLTPSGRAFAVGGRVQNISSDPLSPCIMYWPDNEPFPEQGQIRPSNLVGVPVWTILFQTFVDALKLFQQPPILNTGNRGPIAHAERIALLTSVLAQTQTQSATAQTPIQIPRSHSLTPPQQRRSFVDVSPPQQLQTPIHAPVHRSRSHSHFELSAPSNHSDTSPIYQTSGNRQQPQPHLRQPSPLYSTGPDFNSLPVHAPAPLLPSFLQDMVQSPALSPTSSSSADLSLDEYDDDVPPSKMSFPRTRDAVVNDLPIGNIWRLDGEESKSLSAFALPNSQDLIGNGKREVPRLHVVTS
ncbi:hypothetical protein H0H93_015615 [Arthromyces matolae]|nr:hypothetical protein H0H93_015615 [Arthromyces matolae]